MEPTTVAAVQATPVFLDRDATVDRCVGLVEGGGGRGRRLIVFPETFIPTYPGLGVARRRLGRRVRGLMDRLGDQAVEVPSRRPRRSARPPRGARRPTSSIGVNELDGSTLFNAQLMFAPDGVADRASTAS